MLRWLLPLEFVVFGFATILMIVGTATTGQPPLPVTILWIGAVTWNAYWFLWRIGHSIDVDGTRLTWRAVLRSRTVDVSELTGNEAFGRVLTQLTVRNAPSFVMMPFQNGWLQFLDALNAIHPDHPFAPTTVNRHSGGWLYFSSKTGYYEQTS